MIKVGNTWEITNYTFYRNVNGVLVPTYYNELLQYKITDIKPSNVKCFLIVAFRLFYLDGTNSKEEFLTAIYNSKCKTFSVMEPPVDTQPFALSNLTILKNGNLRADYLSENGSAYVIDFPKTA